MTGAFTAACVSVEEDSSAWSVGFADSEFGARRYLRLHRAKSPRAEDLELGLDGYHVEMDDPSQSCHGGIACFELFHDRAVVAFDADATAVLGGRNAIVVAFALRARQLDQLRACLARIFKDDGCFLDRSA
ncbi:MAG: Imm10 family immunity protein [Burkholderiales bacterium]